MVGKGDLLIVAVQDDPSTAVTLHVFRALRGASVVFSWHEVDFDFFFKHFLSSSNFFFFEKLSGIKLMSIM